MDRDSDLNATRAVFLKYDMGELSQERDLMKFTGIELSNFRSIGEEPVLLSPLQKCNVLIGQNNAGKSNVIRALQRNSWAARCMAKGSVNQGDPAYIAYSAYDVHRRMLSTPFRFRLFFEPDKTVDNEIFSVTESRDLTYEFVWNFGAELPEIIDSPFMRFVDFEHGNRIFHALTRGSFNSKVPDEQLRREILPHAMRVFADRLAPLVPTVYVIPEFRQIRAGDDYSLSGMNLVPLLASYQHPEFGKDTDRERFDLVQTFVRRLLHLPSAALEVTHTGSEIMLMDEGLRLPLSSYGTGVHQLVIMITAVLSLEHAICCIEEPEIHLHPTLQREFLEFISSETSNTYFLSTHSPTFINARSNSASAAYGNLQIFHLRRERGLSVGGPVLKDEHSLAALQDLGFRASDVLQANCIIWVEGPSDRVYINHWLWLLDPYLVEGLHYSIMFYGGRLLAHVSVDRERAADDLIDLLKINQNAIVLIDSDRRSKRAQVNDTKKRVCAECERSGGLCWITDGLEVENYLPANVVTEACRAQGIEVYLRPSLYEKFEATLEAAIVTSKARPWRYADDKVKYARTIVQYFTLEDMGPQLKRRTAAVVEKIASWNS